MVFREVMEEVGEEFSGLAAHQYVGDIIRYHRIQASPGYREAAEYACQRLRGFGLAAQILSYPAREGIAFWAQPSFQEWEARGATLHLVEPERWKLADYHDTKLSLIQRSAPFQGEAELVVLEDGLEEEEYQGLDVRGKVVLTKGDVRRVHYLAVERGRAAGILCDGIKELAGLERRSLLPQALQYTSFWWYGGERRCFGFVLSPQEGTRLRRLAQGLKEEGAPPPRLQAGVDSRFQDGSLEVVSATLPGEGEGEVTAVAHLCHPQWSANDNASGAATLMEIARTLGRLAPPRRTIRFLLVPELTGTHAYLASQEGRIPEMIAGLNLDMVGENQELCGSTLVVERLPTSTPAFAGDLLERILEDVAHETPDYAGTGGYPSFRYGATPFSGGSDHVVLSDPLVGIPTPLLIQWPDRFYHTSLDSWDKVDPQMLARVGKVAGTYLYFLALAGKKEACWLAGEILTRFKERLVRLIQEERGERLARKADHLLNCTIGSLRSLRRLAEVETGGFERRASTFAKRELDEAGVSPSLVTERRGEDELYQLLPHRLYKGPIRLTPYLPRLGKESRERWWRLEEKYDTALWYLLPLTLYWADGRRTLGEIEDLVELETGKRAVELMATYCRLLADLGLIELGRRGSSSAGQG